MPDPREGYASVRFVTRRDVRRDNIGRLIATEHWTDGTETTRVLGPSETVAHLDRADRETDHG